MATNIAPSLMPADTKIPQLFSSDRIPLIPTPLSLQPPPAPVVVTPARTAAAQQEYDRKKNWTLLTPAEILGVPTLESAMGISERNAAGEKKDQTVLERYFERQESDEKEAMSNQMAAFNSSSGWNLQNREQPELNQGFSSARNNPLFGTTQDSSLNGNQDGVTAWSRNFNSQPVSAPVQTPEQAAAAQAAAEDFQKLLQPNLAAPKNKTADSTFPAQAPDALSLFAKPPASPVGNSFTPITSGVIAPQAVTPLFGPAEKNPSTTPVTPQWKRKPPPWMTGPGANQNY